MIDDLYMNPLLMEIMPLGIKNEHWMLALKELSMSGYCLQMQTVT